LRLFTQQIDPARQFSIPQLTPPCCAEMVRLLSRQHGRNRPL
jgi:hypothetical protein